MDGLATPASLGGLRPNLFPAKGSLDYPPPRRCPRPPETAVVPLRGVADQLGIPAVRSRDIERVAVEFGRQRLALASPTRVRLDV